MQVRNFVVVLFLAILLVGPFGIPRFGIDTLLNGQMVLCPFMHGGSVCNMTPLEHAGAAHSMFNVLPSGRDSFLTLLFLLTSVFLVIFLVQKKFCSLARLVSRIFIPHDDYRLPYRPLQEAFSNGLIHSRAF
jgi:lipoprotein signal peptidase